MFVGTDFAPSIAEIRTVLPDCLSRKQQKRVHYAIADAKDQVGMCGLPTGWKALSALPWTG